jgi:anti-repressor protein
MLMSRALIAADTTIKKLNSIVEEMLPKAQYFDALVDRNLLTNFRDTAKELKMPEKQFIVYLIEHCYIYRDKKDQLRPYAEKNKDLFEVKEFINGGWTGLQTLITPKGRETFRLLLGAVQ